MRVPLVRSFCEPPFLAPSTPPGTRYSSSFPDAEQDPFGSCVVQFLPHPRQADPKDPHRLSTFVAGEARCALLLPPPVHSNPAMLPDECQAKVEQHHQPPQHPPATTHSTTSSSCATATRCLISTVAAVLLRRSLTAGHGVLMALPDEDERADGLRRHTDGQGGDVARKNTRRI